MALNEFEEKLLLELSKITQRLEGIIICLETANILTDC